MSIWLSVKNACSFDKLRTGSSTTLRNDKQKEQATATANTGILRSAQNDDENGGIRMTAAEEET
jgi:hypothetical protein